MSDIKAVEISIPLPFDRCYHIHMLSEREITILTNHVTDQVMMSLARSVNYYLDRDSMKFGRIPIKSSYKVGKLIEDYKWQIEKRIDELYAASFFRSVLNNNKNLMADVMKQTTSVGFWGYDTASCEHVMMSYSVNSASSSGYVSGYGHTYQEGGRAKIRRDIEDLVRREAKKL